MASIITATTTSGLTQSADNSGVLQLASGAGNLVTVPSVTGTVMVSGNMPAFSVYSSVSQSTTASAITKVQLNTKIFDTNSNFDSATNYRFTPTIAGYYQINAGVTFITTTINQGLGAVIYKNGTENSWGTATATASMYPTATVSCLVYLNGSTDYIELYVYNGTGFTNSTNGTLSNTYMSGVLVRTA
jgi:hypothetical protein